MSGKGYQTLLECRRRSRLLRELGFTIDQIAIVLSLDHQVSPLRLYRYAAGLTAGQTITACASLDPNRAASLREARLYEYENWPNAGRRPPAHALCLLARIYGTGPERLVTPSVLATYSAYEQQLICRTLTRTPSIRTNRTRQLEP
ncbi:hypothetical protein GBF35_45985 [Nonomuraea phyllanthi]|uniref:hypothetical protein n=1 Tax=Nonomuraea phyllanthi TaxID=2219224 RepID=UPI001292DBAF|nr:hypothetical protein [Nonomuraea phyllanthi]QFY12940.1 hypothetical protein GBF35_45985 [Nonomuraea phyllanthi]